MGIKKNTKIVVYPIDTEDNKYCAIVMGFGKGWYNTGIVVRDVDPVKAFIAAKKQAIKEDLWE